MLVTLVEATGRHMERDRKSDSEYDRDIDYDHHSSEELNEYGKP